MNLFIRQPHLVQREGPPAVAEQPYVGVEPGDKGRYLIGLIGLFGSLTAAHQVLADGYWQKTFKEMASPSRNSTPAKRQEVLSALKADYRRKERKESVAGADEWNSLAESAMKVTPGRLKNPVPVIEYGDLRDAWLAALTAFIDGEPNLQAQRAGIEATGEKDLQISIEHRCRQGVLTQGHRWNCRHCLHTNWVSAASISPVLTCEICRATKSLPADFRWHFHLNDFLAEGLREHGMLGLVWCLGQLQWRAHETFFFAPPLGLYRRRTDNPRPMLAKEVDICCVVDGKFVVGEVKESGREINNALGDELVQLATDVRADKVVIACLDRAAQRKLNQQAARLTQPLAAIGCVLETMVPDGTFGAAAHYLA